MTKAVLRAMTGFFDTNSKGIILNRFSADVGSTGNLLLQTMLSDTITMFFVVVWRRSVCIYSATHYLDCYASSRLMPLSSKESIFDNLP